MTAQSKGKTPDNNKRLAALESGVSTLAIALTANGIKLEEGADPIEAAIGALKSTINGAAAYQRDAGEALKRVDEAEKELHELAGYASATLGRLVPNLDLAPQTDERPMAYLQRLTLEANPALDQLLAKPEPGEESGDATAGEIAAIARAEAAEKKVAELELENRELETDLTEMTNLKNSALNQLADAGKGSGGAPDPGAQAPPPAVVAEPVAERSATARDVGASFGGLTHVAIGALVREGGNFEIAFSNGEFELIDFATAPIKIAAKDLARVDGSRFIVTPALNVKGGHVAATIHGAGLLYNNEQVAYCTFEPAAVILPGQERRFDRSLIFG